MNWQTLHRVISPEDIDQATGRCDHGLTHVRVEGDTRSLCGTATVEDGRFDCPDPDRHPEDIDPLDQCSVCWSVLERRRNEEAGREHQPSNRLNHHVRVRRAPSLADQLGVMA